MKADLVRTGIHDRSMSAFSGRWERLRGAPATGSRTGNKELEGLDAVCEAELTRAEKKKVRQVKMRSLVM